MKDLQCVQEKYFLDNIHCSWLFERDNKIVTEAMKMYRKTENIAVTNSSIL